MPVENLYVNTDKEIVVERLRDRSGTVISDATVVYDLIGPAGTSIASGTLAATATPGQYQAVIESTVFSGFNLNDQFKLKVTATKLSKNAMKVYDLVLLEDDRDV